MSIDIENSAFNKIPNRVRYYLLDWRDVNINDYQGKYGALGLYELTMSQLEGLFSYATSADSARIAEKN